LTDAFDLALVDEMGRIKVVKPFVMVTIALGGRVP
jgi:hypothetical protein